jgi:hypothetical protein
MPHRCSTIEEWLNRYAVGSLNHPGQHNQIASRQMPEP